MKSSSLPVPQLCALISDHFGASVLPHSSVSGETVTASFEAETLAEALEVLTFLTGREVRESGRYYLLGGEGEESLVALPSSGLDESSTSKGPVRVRYRQMIDCNDMALLRSCRHRAFGFSMPSRLTRTENATARPNTACML